MSEELQHFRELFTRALTEGESVANLSDEDFAGRVRRRLGNLSADNAALGFDYECQRLGDNYVVTLTWRGECPQGPWKKLSGIFTAIGRSELLAFFRAAETILLNEHYRPLVCR